MENILTETIKQAPTLTVLTILVWKLVNMFLSAMALSRQEYLASLRQQQNENLEAHKGTRDVIKENTLVSIRTNECLIKLTDAVGALAQETRENTEKLKEK